MSSVWHGGFYPTPEQLGPRAAGALQSGLPVNPVTGKTIHSQVSGNDRPDVSRTRCTPAPRMAMKYQYVNPNLSELQPARQRLGTESTTACAARDIDTTLRSARVQDVREGDVRCAWRSIQHFQPPELHGTNATLRRAASGRSRPLSIARILQASLKADLLRSRTTDNRRLTTDNQHILIER